MVLQRVLHTNPSRSTTNPTKNMCRDLLKVVICNNIFRFHNKYFKQVRGVAMGTRCAPQFANLFLACLEEKALSSWTGPDPLVWLRFLDDIMMLWPGDQEQLQQLLQHLNNQMQSINFTMTSSQENITWTWRSSKDTGSGGSLSWTLNYSSSPLTPDPSCISHPATPSASSLPLSRENCSGY